MKIDHVALYVLELEKAKEFFTHYFGARSNQLYHNPRTGLKTYFLSFDNGARLEIMQRPEVAASQFNQYRTGYIHVAFKLGSKEAVDQLTKQLESDGYKVISGPRTTGDGYYESCIKGFEDNIIELTE